MISIVVAKISRRNEQYNYRIVGKGERYLIQHDEGESPGDKVLQYLTPYAFEPVVIEGTSLQKRCEIIAGERAEDASSIYKGSVAFREETENGKVKKTIRNYYICADNFFEAHEELSVHLSECMGSAEIVSMTKTNIIELLCTSGQGWGVEV